MSHNLSCIAACVISAIGSTYVIFQLDIKEYQVVGNIYLKKVTVKFKFWIWIAF